MREIICKGIDIKTREWVCGYYVCLNGRAHRIYSGYAETDCGNYYPDCHLVVPKTVGQYTGLTDKNGKKIFEGDIVKFCDIKGVINYGMGCFCVKTNKPDWKSRNNPAIDIVLNEYENELEVIGNIHDNPELLSN